MALADIYPSTDPTLFEVRTQTAGPRGRLPVTPQQLREAPSGDIFGMTMNAGMGWNPDDLNRDGVMIVSTKGGATDAAGNPIALGLHTGHYQLGMLVESAAREVAAQGALPYATYVSDSCDGRSQGTFGMFDSVPYRNDAAIVMRRLIRSLPTRRAVMGVASCDKGLPAMMMALASMHNDPTILVPGGSTLLATDGDDLGSVQTIGVRYTAGELSHDDAAEAGCRACASPGGSCQFFGTGATSQVIGEALGMALTHSALAPSGEPIWHDLGRASAHALLELKRHKVMTRDILTDHAVENAMVLHAAFGGSTNLLLHLPAIAHAAGCHVPTVDDWARINAAVPRLVSVLPLGPVHYPTSMVFLAGGVPEVMLHLRSLGLLHGDVLTVTGETLDANLDWWATSDRRALLRRQLLERDGVDPDDVILSPAGARAKAMTSTVTFPKGNIAPEGSVVKSTAIDPQVVDADGVFRHTGQAKVFTSERAAITAIRQARIREGDIMVVAGAGPQGTGMEETYQLTSALKKLPFGKHVSLITDARFSGVSTGACFGHVGPEALAEGPIGKLRDGDLIEIVVDTLNLTGSLNFIGTPDSPVTHEEGAAVLASREPHPGLAPNPDLPDDTRLWAALQDASGGTWGGCVYDVDRIIEMLAAGKRAPAASGGQ